MKRCFDEKTNFHVLQEGDKVWLRKKCYKTGENKKLSPRRTGPWTIAENLANGVNFRITIDGDKTEKVVHHNRLTKNIRKWTYSILIPMSPILLLTTMT